ncbi:hypothetical protein ACT1U9_30695 [Streptomyces sp. BR1]|uniref:hypothetical protein n=1 Tax=Streptomyces sp. BR1 TaxID=1592323 RepID=UPI00402B667E
MQVPVGELTYPWGERAVYRAHPAQLRAGLGAWRGQDLVHTLFQVLAGGVEEQRPRAQW